MKDLLVYTRQSPRYPTSMFVRCEGERDMRECRGNVSAGGFCFEGAEKLQPGTKVELLFRVPGAGVWLSGAGVILGCVEGDSVLALRGRFTDFDLGDPRFLDGWFDMIRRQRNEKGHTSFIDDPDEVTLYSTTV